MFEPRCSIEDVPGIGSITGDRRSSHSSEARAGERSHAHRGPRHEPDATGLAGIEHVRCPLLGLVEAVLNGRDVDQLTRSLELVDGHLGDPGEPDLALVLELADDSELLLEGHLGIDAVKLPEVNAIEPVAASGSPRIRPGGTPGARREGRLRFRPPLVAITRPSG